MKIPERNKRIPILCALLLCLLLSGCGSNAAGAALRGTLEERCTLLRVQTVDAVRGGAEALVLDLASLSAQGRSPAAKQAGSGVSKAPAIPNTYGAEGTAGRLVIPAVGINVGLNLPGEDAQAVTDAPDSACWMEARGDANAVIGDHVNQDFSALFRIRPGDECLIFRGGRAYRYVCLATLHASNTETDVIDEQGRSLFSRGEDRLCMYTCENGWRNVFAGEWQALGKPLHQLQATASQLFLSEDAP